MDDDQQQKIQEVVRNVIAKYTKARNLPTEQPEETVHPEEDKHPEDNSKVDNYSNNAKENDSGSANDVFAWARGIVPRSELHTLPNVPDAIKDIIVEKTPSQAVKVKGKVLNDREKALALGGSSFKFADKPVEVVFDQESHDLAGVKGYVATNLVVEIDEALEPAL